MIEMVQDKGFCPKKKTASRQGEETSVVLTVYYVIILKNAILLQNKIKEQA